MAALPLIVFRLRITCASPQRDLFALLIPAPYGNSALGLSVRTLRDSDRKKDGGLPRGRAWLCVVAALLCAAALLAPAAAAARDLVVYGEPTLEKALKSVGSLWQARTGARVNVFVAPTELSYAQIDRGARCDVIFALAGAATEEAARAKIIQGATISRALRNGLVLVGTEGAAGPLDGASLAEIGRAHV